MSTSYARSKLKRYLREEMPNFVDNVKVSQILDHLPCLPPSDREEIEAKEQNKGNRVAVPLLLSCLTRRENWAEELISALEACELWEMAADMRRVYDSPDSQGNPKPKAPAAHVHPPPPDSQVAVVAPPPPSPPEPAAQVSPPPAASDQPETPAQPETPPSLAAEASAEAAPSSEPAPQAPQSPPMRAVHPRATPPASPETSRHPTATTSSPSPPPVHQEPEENSYVDLQVVSGDKGPGTDEASDRDSEVSGVSSEEETPTDPEPPVKPLVKLHAVAATSQPRPVQTATPEVSPPQSPSPPQTALDETDESTCTTMTPEKCPVQETAPPKDNVASAVLEPEELFNPIATQITDNCQHTVSTGTSTLLADGQNASFSDEDDVQLSKPGPLVDSCPTVSNSHQVETGIEAPYSGTSSRLEMSDSVPTTQVSAPRHATPTPSPPPYQENGVVEELLPHNEPEENQYESPCQSSLGDREVLFNVVHVSEPPSIQNQDGQTPSMLGNVSETQPVRNNNSEPEVAIESPSSVSPELSSYSCEDNQGKTVVGHGASMSEGAQLHILKGQATSALTKELNSAPELPATAVTVSFNAASNDNCHPSKSGAAEDALELKPQDPMHKKASSSTKSSHTKYFMIAVGVSIFATLIMAWKMKR